MFARSRTDRVLLISGVATQRSDDPREGRLTRRLHKGIVDAAGGAWRVVTTWGESDGTEGALQKLEQADAVVIMGGPDLSPDLYGGAAEYPNAERHFPRSDDAQLSIIERSIADGIPMLGICRGMQALNVALGGTLQQDIGVPGHSNSSFLDDLLLEEHTVAIEPSSRLSHMLQIDSSDNVLVRSAHHQAVEQVGSDLRAIASASDGIVEAVEHEQAPAFGVQWHPEAVGSHPEHLRRLIGFMGDAGEILRLPAGTSRAA